VLDIYPDRIAYFDKKHSAQTFVLMVVSEAKDEIVLHYSNDYNECQVIFFESC